MATTAKGKTEQGAGEDPGAVDEKAVLEEQLGRIKADISELASTLAAMGSRRLGGARGEADHRMRELTRAGEEAIDDLRRQVRTIERDLSDKVQEKPLQTLGIAAGIGFLLALVLRR